MPVRKFARVISHQIIEYPNRYYPTTSPNSINTADQDGTLSSITHKANASASNANLVSDVVHPVVHPILGIILGI